MLKTLTSLCGSNIRLWIQELTGVTYHRLREPTASGHAGPIRLVLRNRWLALNFQEKQNGEVQNQTWELKCNFMKMMLRWKAVTAIRNRSDQLIQFQCNQFWSIRTTAEKDLETNWDVPTDGRASPLCWAAAPSMTTIITTIIFINIFIFSASQPKLSAATLEPTGLPPLPWNVLECFTLSFIHSIREGGRGRTIPCDRWGGGGIHLFLK